ncbi:MAG: hypothetical protein ACM31F_06835 [Gemmatimonas sp.]
MRSDLSIGLDVSLDQTSVCVIDENAESSGEDDARARPMTLPSYAGIWVTL